MKKPNCLDIDARGALRLRVRVEPRASRPGLAGLYGSTLKVRISAPPVEGKANADLLRVVAKAFGLRKAQIEIVSGRSSKNKTLRITDCPVELVVDVIRALP